MKKKKTDVAPEVTEAPEKTETDELSEQPTEQKKSKKILKTIFNVVINILIVFVLIISLLIAIMALTSKSTGISRIFGWTIQSDSMQGSSPDGYKGGNVKPGDLVIGKATNFDDYAEYYLGDVVTFIEYDDQDRRTLVAHRIVDKVKIGNEYRYQTWGDNREVAFIPDQQFEEEFLPAYEIASVISSEENNYNALVIPGLGGFLDMIKSEPIYFFLIILLPMIIFFMYALIRTIINAGLYRKAKQQESVDEAVAAALAEKEAKDAEGVKPEDMTPEQMEQFKKFLEQQKSQKEDADSDQE